MATIVRVKRRRYEDPAENIVLSCKKLKSDIADTSKHETDGCESYLKFAGTVISKDEVISKHIKDAIRKEKLQREYKSHQPGALPRSRRHKKESSKANRFKITSSFRALDLAALDKECDDCVEKKISPLKSTDVCDICKKESAKHSESKTSINASENCEKELDLCNCRKNVTVNSAEGVEKEQRNLHEASSVANGAQSAEKVYHLYDVEVNQSNLPTFESLIQEAQNASLVTCNSEQMVHEQVPQEKEEDYVYDLYYTNSRDFNLQLFESSLSIHSLYADNLEYGYNGEEDHEIYEDEDDENEESNWRNDYPDEDPRFIEEEEDVDFVYGNGVDDYQAFGYEDRGLVEWMSSRCNIEDESDESSNDDTDDENPTGYGHYKQRVMRELEIDNS
ncbi:probable RNA polymerase II nuclear localization protein SLC7A6OS [Saccostrea echinata]|uniref:probable RNA polymerase II nuclear localization protein SLC7A6OS n=1 Tax=Saccostrea echinata TaxID=191078 RepID=UPI002A7ED23A|nr:probable RNA polymerase II nuclear localization protein SLC7A6OS [Saccostrea echinata]